MTASIDARSDKESMASASTAATGATAATPDMSGGTDATITSNTEASVDKEKQRRIAEAAYYRAERRGFFPGSDQDDWFEAERELDSNTSAARNEESR
jgi:hypothetical protein